MKTHREKNSLFFRNTFIFSLYIFPRCNSFRPSMTTNTEYDVFLFPSYYIFDLEIGTAFVRVRRLGQRVKSAPVGKINRMSRECYYLDGSGCGFFFSYVVSTEAV